MVLFATPVLLECGGHESNSIEMPNKFDLVNSTLGTTQISKVFNFYVAVEETLFSTPKRIELQATHSSLRLIITAKSVEAVRLLDGDSLVVMSSQKLPDH